MDRQINSSPSAPLFNFQSFLGPKHGGDACVCARAFGCSLAYAGVTGQAMKEAQGINKSLSALGDVMEALDKGQGHIPFRNSKLT